MKFHYHVLSGMHGCMPNNNDYCETKQEARENLKFWIREFRESGLKFSGNLKSGYFECINENWYVEISKCDMDDCYSGEF